MFGSTQGTTGGFGGGFGQPQAQSQAQTTGTGNPKFQVTSETDPNGTVNHQSITAMQAYNKKSFEELRWEDYQAGKKNATAAASVLAQQPAASMFIYYLTYIYIYIYKYFVNIYIFLY